VPSSKIRRILLTSLAGLFLCVLPARGQSGADTSGSRASNELDAFMEKVLARREQNRITLQQYVLDEVEMVEVLGPGRMPLYRLNRDFRWYVRDGLHVRSPVRFDGVTVGDDDRKKYEEEWIERERRRLERKDKKDEKAADQEPPPEPTPRPADPSGATAIPTPRFVSEAYFMEFKFEPGNYYLAGRERLEGQEVLRIEYYPRRMFNDDDDRDKEKGKDKDKEEEREQRQSKRDEKARERELEQRIERQMNKTAMITLWVDPAEHQIVKYTFDNVWMDFLPGAWLVKVDDIRASMTMGQPFPGVWLPRGMEIHGGVTLANGSYEATYKRGFSEYRQADVTTKLRVPKGNGGGEENEEASGPFVPDPETPQPAVTPAGAAQEVIEVIAEVRVHGNAFVDDASVIALAGIAIGQPWTDATLQNVEQRLKSSGRFEAVEVRKRYRSLDNTTDIVVLLVVHERPGVTSVDQSGDPVSGSWRRLRSRLMFLPILSYADGYGFTYGARFSTLNLLGIDERLSFPLTWGGTRRAAVEFERTFKTGPLTRIESTFGIWQRENPRFEIDDRRLEWTGRAERVFGRFVRTGVGASSASVDFDTLDDHLWTIAADVALDTRSDPAFPRNAVFLGTGWTGLSISDRSGQISKYSVDARGYVGVIRQLVLATRAQFTSADAPLPPYERLLLGGSSTLRGFGTGTFDGDRRFVTSAELRLPITSILSSAKLGVSAFFDAGTVYDAGQRLENAAWHRGVGGGVFLIASVFRLNLDIAHGLKTGDTHVHFGMGFPF
jgi:surface antigen Omp85-like protein/POTRA domain-containing FtsQ-type protein